MSNQTQTTAIALDSNALKHLFKHHDLVVHQRVAEGTLRVYVPVIVYAEQAIYPAYAIDNVVEALNAQVIPLEIDHARQLGELWQNLPDPFRRQRKRELWRQHKFDWLITAMVCCQNWILVTDDQGAAFCTPGLQTLTVDEFIGRYLTAE